jgi:N-acetylmuramoyl-L-alanine amidase
MIFATLILLLSSAPAAKIADPAEGAWQAAKAGRTELKADEKKKKFRHNWQNVAKKLEGFSQKYPKNAHAPEALLLAAQTYEELSKISQNSEDLDSARKLYARAQPPAPAPGPQKKKKSDAPPKVEQQVTRIADAFKKLELPKVEKVEKPRPAAAPIAEEAAAVADDESLHVPSMEEIAEKLRDVRVGQREVKAMKSAMTQQELTLAEQLGLKVRRVIIDAGHGGHDTGAIGKGGTLEKDVALAIAQKLQRLLTEAGLEVLMTRDDDTFVRLEDRTKFANQHKGDLFISVHCNSAPTHGLGGVETYTLNTSSDRYNVRLAARENATTERGVGDLQLILADLATKANTEESGRLANRVQRELVQGLKDKNPSVRDLGHKEALFFVLLGAKMPAILVETSFLSNPTEERLLSSDAYQRDVADAISEGVKGFLEERSKVAQVD